MATPHDDLKGLIERLTGIGQQLSKAAVTMDKLDVNWEVIPSVPGPFGLADQACTQNNQCEPNPGCTQNSSC
jgi:hypothetical protein